MTPYNPAMWAVTFSNPKVGLWVDGRIPKLYTWCNGRCDDVHDLEISYIRISSFSLVLFFLANLLIDWYVSLSQFSLISHWPVMLVENFVQETLKQEGSEVDPRSSLMFLIEQYNLWLSSAQSIPSLLLAELVRSVSWSDRASRALHVLLYDLACDCYFEDGKSNDLRI